MFKDPSNRGARNMLKGMGGIMSSSPELANAVKGYADGDQVRVPIASGLTGIILDLLDRKADLKLEKGERQKINPFGVLSTPITLPQIKATVNQEKMDEFLGRSVVYPGEVGTTNLSPEEQALETKGQGLARTLQEINDTIFSAPIKLYDRGVDYFSEPTSAAEKLIAEMYGETESGQTPTEVEDTGTAQTGTSLFEDEILDKKQAEQLEKFRSLERYPGKAIDERGQPVDLPNLKKIEEELGVGETGAPPEVEDTGTAESDKYQEKGQGLTGAPPEVEMSGTAAAVTTAITDPLPDSFGNSHEEKVSTIEEMMTQFMSKAPEFKGLDKGMAIAKIGFAMAAGQSPNALTNIANALSMGADMFIEDKKERDAFERQLGLAALKYGMQEDSAVRAQNRADLRSRNLYVVGKDPVTIEGVKYQSGQHVTLNEAQVQTLGPKMKNLASIEAMEELNSIFIDKWEAQFGKVGEGLSWENARKLQKEYMSAIDTAQDATRALGAFDTVFKMLDDPNRAPFSRGVLGKLGAFYTKGKTFFGLNTLDADGQPKKYNTEEEIKSILLSTMSDIVEVTVGDTQSANSISDRDVLYQVIKPYFAGIITGSDETGWTVNLEDEGVVRQSLGRAMQKLYSTQVQRLNDADQIEMNLGLISTVKGYGGSGLSLITTQKPRRDAFGYSGTETGTPTFDVLEKDGALQLNFVGGT